MLFQEIKLFIACDILFIGYNFLNKSEEWFKRFMKGMGGNHVNVTKPDFCLKIGTPPSRS